MENVYKKLIMKNQETDGQFLKNSSSDGPSLGLFLFHNEISYIFPFLFFLLVERERQWRMPCVITLLKASLCLSRSINKKRKEAWR